jgi:hypothetical protein
MLVIKPKDQREFNKMLIEEDIIGLDPRYNLITPFDLVLGTYTKGYQGAKGIYRGVQMIRYGLGRFGTAKIVDSLMDIYTFTSKGVDMYQHFGQSPGQDMTLPGSPGRQIPKTPGGTKSSRGVATAAPQTLKPFWSNGKPKCRKGYRYDFKRKMCVKKS